jgi:ADP-heptose:LPS heptosyltransferase
LQQEHAIQQNLRLVQRWTGTISPDRVQYSFPVDPMDRAYIDGYLEEWGIRADQGVICIHPGTGTWVKHWMEENWAKVADILAEQLNGQIVLSGSDREIPLAQRIADQMKHTPIIMTGDTRVGQLAALFQRAKVVLGPDSGPLHLAAAVAAPTVALYGPADPVEFGPWGDPQRQIALTSDIGCRPCRILDWDSDDPAYHPCLREITVGRVLEAARRASRA